MRAGSGYNAQVFYKETSTSFVFPQETKEQLEADRTMEAAEVDAIKQGLKNAGWPTELRRAYLFSSTFRSSGNKKNAIAPSESSSVMSSKMSGAKSMRSDVKSEMNGGSIFRSHSILHGIRSLNGKSGTKISVSEVSLARTCRERADRGGPWLTPWSWMDRSSVSSRMLC